MLRRKWELKHTDILITLGDEVARVTKEKCGPALGETHLCEDSTGFAVFGACLKGNLMPVIMSHITELMPLVAEPMCKKEKAYLESPQLWEKVIPKYIEEYSKTCKKL